MFLANDIILFFMAESNSVVYILHIFFNHSVMHG